MIVGRHIARSAEPMSSFQRVRPLAHKGAVSRPVEATRVGRERDRELARRPHGSATTTPSIREAIQASSEKNTVLATRYGVNRKTVAKWKRRSFSSDLQMRPKNPRSLTLNDQVIIVAYRWRTRLSLDESHVRLRRLMPQLSRSALYRCLERYGLSKIGRTNIS
jgi:DNA-binding transcriptional regulator YiaG